MLSGMYLNQLTRVQGKYLQHCLQKRELLNWQRCVNSYTKATQPPPMNAAHRAGHLLLIRNSRKSLCRCLCSHNNNTVNNLDEFDAVTILKGSSSSSTTKDALMTELMATVNNYQQLLQFLTENHQEIQPIHYVQSLNLLWAFFKSINDPQLMREMSESLEQQLLPLLEPHVPHMNIDTLSCCYLYLRKMQIPNGNPVIEMILLQALHMVESSASDISNVVPLTSLSRLAVGINLNRDFFTPLVCRNFVPHLERHLMGVENVCNEQQVHLLSTCFFQLHPLISTELLSHYKHKVRELMATEILTSKTPRTMLKILHTLNLSTWSASNSSLIRDVMLVLRPHIPHMIPSDLKAVCRTFLHHQEPASLMQPLKMATERLLHEEEHSPDALACAVPFAEPEQREQYIKEFKSLLYTKSAWQLPNASSHFFSALRALKIADVKICDYFWNAVVEELNTGSGVAEDQMSLRFLRHCQHYMNFNNNLGGTYRHRQLERTLSQLCMQAIEYDIAGRLPEKFARLASFVLAYGHTPFAWKKFPNNLLSKILAMAPQFDIQDCFHLSRGIQIACELRFRHQMPELLAMQLLTIDSTLIACTERHLATAAQQHNANELSIMVRTLSHRKSLKSTVAYKQTLAHYKELHCDDLNSRVVRDMAYNFNASHYYIPELLNAMFAYVTQHHSHISGETVEKVLTCAYNLGFIPQDLESLHYAADALLRDFEHMSGLSIVQASLALCFYKTVPEELINRVFCIKFIQRIEDEIQICYSKATYPERVLNLVMQLNRTVCLDVPESNVPWFQENFVEAQLSKKPIMSNNSFTKDVKRLLNELLKEEIYFRCNHTTPYGYHIDFVIHFDNEKKPMPAPPAETTMLDRITKVAILLLKLDSYCENDLNVLRGPEALKVKHLEMLGYKVLHINEHDWNSKYMAVPGAKSNYLKCLLQISR